MSSVPALERLATLRARLARVLLPAPLDDEATPWSADVVVTPVEVNEKHGTGVLVQRLFGGSPDLVSVRSVDAYGGVQAFGDHALLVAHPRPTPERIADAVAHAFRGIAPRRVVCIPYFADDVRTTLELVRRSGAPLCTYVMDDQNVESSGIPDSLFRPLLERSRLRLAISAEMARAYEGKYGLPFGFLPPVVEPTLLCTTPSVPSLAALASRRGVIVGNIWGESWLQGLRALVRGSDVALDWYSNSGNRWVSAQPEALAADGIHVRGGLPEARLSPVLRAVPYVVVPSGTGAPDDSHRFLARLSLPSKIPYILATSNTPVLVVGQAEDAAARFVAASGTGLVVPYDRAAFLAAVAELSRPEIQARLRARAAALAPSFAATGAREWIWRSLEAGRPIDDRWDRLLTLGGASAPGARA